MSVQYRHQHYHRYICAQERSSYGGELCQSLSGACLDESISEQVLQALEPAALALSLEAAKHLEQERTELDQLWQKRLERSAFEAQRAGRHYRLVEPENRLVARQLAVEWETKLNVHQQLQEDYQRFTHQQPTLLSEEEQQSIRKLAQDIPALWKATTTTQAQRQEIIRQVIRKITVDVAGESEHVKLTIEWMGHSISTIERIRPVAKWTQLSNYPQLCQRLKQLVHAGATTEEIVQSLNQEGFYPPKRRQTLNAEEVRILMRRLGLGSTRISTRQGILGNHEWWLPSLARVLGMPTVTLYNWVQRGWVKARQQTEWPKPWIVWADEAELERLKTHRQRPSGEILHQRWQGDVPAIAVPPESGQANLS